jgi:hypothetical protein
MSGTLMTLPEKILIVEDEVLVAVDLKEMILSLGYAVAGITGNRNRPPAGDNGEDKKILPQTGRKETIGGCRERTGTVTGAWIPKIRYNKRCGPGNLPSQKYK